MVRPAGQPEAHPLCGRSRRGPGGVRHGTSGSASEPASPPRTPPRSARCEPSGDGRVRGARGRSPASAVPCQRRLFVFREPHSRRLRPRVASRKTSELDVGYSDRLIVDFTGGLVAGDGGLRGWFCTGSGGLGGWFSGRWAGPCDWNNGSVGPKRSLAPPFRRVRQRYVSK